VQRRAFLVSATALLAGCGFALRKPPQLAFDSLYLQMPPGSTLGPLIIRSLQFNPRLRVLTAAQDRASADAILDVQSEQREKVVVAFNAAGQVREFDLRLRLRFRLITPQGRELIPDAELLLSREIGFAETAVLAKEEEEALLYRDMRNDMVQQLMRRLSSVTRLDAGPLPPVR